MSNIFLDESFQPLNEGLISWAKKHWTGKDDDEIVEFTNDLNKASTKAAVQSVIDDIQNSLDKCEKFKGLMKAGSFSQFIHGGLITKTTADKYDEQGAKNDLVKHEGKLKALLAQAKSKLAKVK